MLHGDGRPVHYTDSILELGDLVQLSKDLNHKIGVIFKSILLKSEVNIFLKKYFFVSSRKVVCLKNTTL